MSFWEKTKDSASKAANATKKASQKAKLKTEIAILNSKIKTAKEKFGVSVYPYLVNDDESGLRAVFQETKLKIDELVAQVTAKEQTIRNLDGKGTTPQSDEQPQHTVSEESQYTHQEQEGNEESHEEHEYTEEKLQYQEGEEQHQQ